MKNKLIKPQLNERARHDRKSFSLLFYRDECGVDVTWKNVLKFSSFLNVIT